RARPERAAGARQREPHPAGVLQPDPERARRHAERRVAHAAHARRRRDGGRRGERHRARDPPRAHPSHLRPLLHDQGHRQGHRAGPFGLLRHRPGARRRDLRRERPRPGHHLPGGAARARAPGRRPAGFAMSQEQVLVVDDEEVMRDVLGRVLAQAGYEVAFAENGPKGIELARKGTFAAAIVDVMLFEMGGFEVLEELKKHDSELVVLMITAFASMEMAIDAIKKGAFYFVPKPFDNQQLLHILASGLLQRRLADENRQLRTALRDQGRFMELVGKSQRMLQVFQLVAQVAPSRSTILVAGESGTGKELVAKAIHQNSPRKDKPFVVVNSGSLPHELLESNLFGHVKGAFTGAFYSKKGLFELADKGTLFFDEIGNIPIETQAKLLRVMQEREFMRLGGV